MKSDECYIEHPLILSKSRIRSMSATVVDVFCGVGGLTRGFVDEGFDVVAGYDADGSCEYAYEHNNEGATFYGKDLYEEDFAAHLEDRFSEGHTKILIGCAPCQPFSSYSNTRKKKEKDWQIVRDFADVVERVDPDVVSMENVTRLRSFDDGAVFGYFKDVLESLGHHVFDENVYCPNYGVPQTRRRLVLLSSRFGEIELIEPECEPGEYRTAGDVIEDLDELENGEVSEGDRYHKVSSLSDLNLRRIRASEPGGTWEDWDEDLLAACHRRESGSSYKSVYGRMERDAPAPTITTQFFCYGRGRFGHYEQDRALSIREGALLQTFPPNYEFVEPDAPVYFTSMGRHIGNAVPVRLARAIAKSIKRHLKAHV